MKTMLDSRRGHYLARCTIILITAALIAGMAGCAYDVVMERSFYSLTIASNSGGSVTTPGEGEFAYDAKTVVNLMAEANAGYRFVIWIGNVATIADVNAATTTITMNNDYSITARFEEIPPDQYSLTIASTTGGQVTTPGEGTFLYDEGTLVNLVAEAEDGFHFVNWTDDVAAIANLNLAITTITMNGDYTITSNFVEQVPVEPMVAAGGYHTVGLRSDGTVVAVGYNEYGQCDVGRWTGIIQVAAGLLHTAGVKSNFIVVAAGRCDAGQCDFSGSDWTDIIQVAAGAYHTVGLRSNGRVVAAGDNSYGQRNVGGWADIVRVAAGGAHTVALKSNDTVVTVGDNAYGQRDVGGWTDIIQIAAGGAHTVGLKSNGSVVAVGAGNGVDRPHYGQCDVGNWTDIVQVAAGELHTVGLKANGTVVAVGDSEDGQCDVGDWTDIIQVAAAGYHTVGLRSDGSVLAAGYNSSGQCDVSDWDLSASAAAMEFAAATFVR